MPSPPRNLSAHRRPHLLGQTATRTTHALPYLGQPVPGLTSERFATGIISTERIELNGVFAPDRRECYFTRLVGGVDTDTMQQMVFADAKWSPPREHLLLPNQARMAAADMVTPDGKYLFCSRYYGETWATTTGGDVYWVDIRVLNPFRPENTGGVAK